MSRAELGHALAIAGRTASAEAILRELVAMSEEAYVSPFWIAVLHVGRNQADGALEWLHRAVDERDPLVLHMQIEPRLDPLRSDPRFGELVSRIRFPS